MFSFCEEGGSQIGLTSPIRTIPFTELESFFSSCKEEVKKKCNYNWNLIISMIGKEMASRFAKVSKRCSLMYLQITGKSMHRVPTYTICHTNNNVNCHFYIVSTFLFTNYKRVNGLFSLKWLDWIRNLFIYVNTKWAKWALTQSQESSLTMKTMQQLFYIFFYYRSISLVVNRTKLLKF